MRFISIAIFLTLLSRLASYGASPEVEWVDSVVDLGLVKEWEGEKRVSFIFHNNGKNPVTIRRVSPSCACVNVSFTETPIGEGEGGVLDFTLNPIRKTGKINEEIKVYLSEFTEPIVLKVRGRVLGDEKTLNFKYPHCQANLRSERDQLFTGALKKGEGWHQSFEIYNVGNDTVSVIPMNLSPGLELRIASPKLLPGEETKVTAEVETENLEFYGRGELKGALYFSSSPEDSLPITVKTIIIPHNQDSRNREEPSGTIHLSSDIVEVNGESGEIKVSVENIGKGKLIIYDVVTPPAGNISFLKGEMEVGAGEINELKFLIDIEKLPPGVFRFDCEIISDDEMFPVLPLRIVGIRR